MVTIIAFPLLLLAAGMLTLIIYAIVSKKWALLLIPAVLVLAGLWFSMISFEQTASVQSHPAPAHPEYESASDAAGSTSEYNINSSINITRDQPSNSPGSDSQAIAKHFFIFNGFGLLVLIVFVIITRIAIKRKNWAVLYIPLGVVGLLFIAVIFFRVRPVPKPSGLSYTSDVAVYAERPVMVASTESSPDQLLPPVWSPGIEKEFTAGVYYSKTAVLRGIAGYVDRIFRQKALDGNPIPKQLALVTYKDQFSKELLEEAITIFEKILPETECYTAAAGKKTFTKDDTWISMELTESPSRPGSIRVNGVPVNSYLNKDDFKSGKIKFSLHMKTGRTTTSLSYTQKPWLENFSAFQNNYPRQLMVAYSLNTCSSHNQARNEALNRALQIVKPMVQDRASHVPNSGFTLAYHDLSRHGIIVDEFTQSFQGTTTPIYRHALLLDVSPDRLESVVLNRLAAQNQKRQSWAYHIMSAIGVAIAICVIYLILNAATRGYYTPVLRIVTVIGIIVVVLLALKMVA